MFNTPFDSFQSVSDQLNELLGARKAHCQQGAARGRIRGVDELAQKISEYLTAGLFEIPDEITIRLCNARINALKHKAN